MCAVARGGIAFTGCAGLPVTNASTSSVFHAKTRSAGVSPGSPHCASIDGTSGFAGLDVGKRRAHGRGNRRRSQRLDQDAAARIDERRDGVREDRSRIREKPAPVAGVMAAFAQVDREVEIESTARAQEQRRPLRVETRAVGGDQHVGGERRALALAQLAQSRRTGLLAGLEQHARVEAEMPARGEHLLERREIDRVLALVVGRAAAIPALALARELPRREPRDATARRSPGSRRRGRTSARWAACRPRGAPR